MMASFKTVANVNYQLSDILLLLITLVKTIFYLSNF